MATARLVKYKGKSGDIWRIRLDYVDHATGKRRRPWDSLPLGTTKRQAEARMRDLLAALGEAPPPSAEKISLATLLVHWLEQDARGRLAVTSLASYEATVRVHLIPTLGMIPLAKITPPLLATWQHTYLGSVGGRTAQLCHLRLSQGLDYAVRLGYLSRNPLAGIRLPSHVATAKEIWSPPECARFLAAAEHAAYFPLWHWLLGTGTRRGEGLGLRWRDLDSERGIATIAQSVVALGGRGYIKSPKTAASYRQVPVPPELFTLLDQLPTPLSST